MRRPQVTVSNLRNTDTQVFTEDPSYGQNEECIIEYQDPYVKIF